MALECNVTCVNTGLSLTNAYSKVTRTVCNINSGKCEGVISVFKDNGQTSPIFHIPFVCDCDMTSGTDGHGSNPFHCAEQALINDTATFDSPEYATTFVGATVVA